MRQIRPFPLIAILLAPTACSPACNAPEAQQAEAPGAPAADPRQGLSDAPAVPPAELIKEAKGVSLGSLAGSQLESFYAIINAEPSACDKPHSLAHSLRDDATCRDSLVAAQFVADRLAAGATPSTIREELDEVTDALKPRQIPSDGRPVWGNVNAPVTVIVFADFTCPHCKAEAPVLRAAIEQFRGRAKLVYRYFPLSGPGHDRSRPASLAAEAAFLQGKFWEMHDRIFAHQQELEDADLDRYAAEIGLDMAKFHADLKNPAVAAAVDADRAAGEKLDFPGTPTVYVNGRMYTQALFGGTVEGWIDDALKR